MFWFESISVLRAFSLIVFPTDDDDDNPNYFNGALLYFILGAIAQILNIALVFLASKTDFYRFYMNNRDQQPQDQVEESGLLNGGSPAARIIYPPLPPVRGYINLKKWLNFFKKVYSFPLKQQQLII